MKQVNTKKITGTIKVLTGLHIGAGSDTIEIGGMDNPIVKNPVTNEPYIPGSSLKGKMRALTEWHSDKVLDNEGDPCSCGKADCMVCRVFGTSAGNVNTDRGPTRLIVIDAHLSEKSRSLFYNENYPLVEEKAENSINRITARANPRPIERVVPGTEFDFEIVYRVIDTGDSGKTDEEYFESVVLKALQLVENDFLGGGGSRGNGKVKFINLKDEQGNEIKLEE